MEALTGLAVDAALQERRTTSDRVAEALRGAILSGRFRDGEELNQVALAQYFNVSRVPVREALRQLQAEGLVEGRAHRRAVVVGLDRARVREIVEICCLLEAYMLERAAVGMDAGRIARLRSCCDAMERARDVDAWFACNREFHQLLTETAQSPTARALVDQLAGQVERYLRRTGPERAAEAVREHRAVVDALDRGDVIAAKDAVVAHLANSLQFIFTERE